jgi:hypothetical protein
VASFGNQLDGQDKEKSNYDDIDSASTKSLYHSMSSTTLKNWAKENSPNQSEMASAVYGSSRPFARATTTDIEKMAEKWYQQLQKLDHNSPARAGVNGNTGLHGSSANTQKRSISHTYPLSHQASSFRDLPRESAMRLWPRTQGLDHQASGTTNDSKNQDTSGHDNIRRHTLSFDAQLLSDSWWSESNWKRPKNGDSVDLAKIEKDDILPTTKEVASHLSPVASQDTEMHKGAPLPEPESSYSRVFSSGIEKAIRSGIKKVMYRKQVSTQSPTALTPAAAVSSRSLNPQCPVTASHSKASSLNAKKSTTTSQVTTPVLESKTQVVASEPPETPCCNDEDVIQDVDSIFGVLDDMESNQLTVPTTPMQPIQSKADDNSALLESDIASPETIPATPIANAYAEVQEYISAILPGTLARRLGVQQLQNSPSSSYTSHQGSDAVCVTTPENVQVTAHKSLDSISVKSDSAPAKKVREVDTASTKYMTWNGRTMPNAPLLKSTAQFSAELENIFQGRKENRKAFQGHPLQPTLKQN